MNDERFSTVREGTPPEVAFPRRYNAAVDLLERHLAAGRGAKVAVRDDSGAVTYSELAERVDRAGNALAALGVRHEERVLLALLDTRDFPAVFLGAIKLGAVPVPVNTLMQPQDYAHFAKDSRARVLVVSDALLPKFSQAIAESRFLQHVLVARTPLGGEPGAHPLLEDLLARASPQLEAADTCADDAAFWLYSSGSTGAAKAAVHLQTHLVQTAVLYAQQIVGVGEGDVIFSAAKLFFAYGLGNGLTFPLYAGATAVLMAERPTPAAVMRRLREESPSIFCGVPTLFASLLADPALASEPVPARLRLCLSAGEPLPRHLGERWRARFGCDILDGLGSTEMPHIFLSNRPGEVRYGTTGRPVPGYTLELRGDDGESVADGEEGALWVRGPTACAHYFNQREKSLATFHGAWTRTGDRYLRAPDGTFTYCGRSDDMLKVGGIWVSPFEVESLLSSHEAVLEAAVVGHEDADGLIKPKAYVVVKPGAQAPSEEELKLFVKEKLAPFKYPRWVEFVDGLPKTATGKIQRFKLRG